MSLSVTGAGGVLPWAAARPAEKNSAARTTTSIKPCPPRTRKPRRKTNFIRDNSWLGAFILDSRSGHGYGAGDTSAGFGRVGPGGDERAQDKDEAAGPHPVY